jgi:hypothetical protein
VKKKKRRERTDSPADRREPIPMTEAKRRLREAIESGIVSVEPLSKYLKRERKKKI